MIKVSIYNQDQYKIPSQKVKNKLEEVLARGGIVTATVSLAFVDDDKIEDLVEKYYKGDPESKYYHPILTFPNREANGKFVVGNDNTEDLGEIVISYPQALQRARDENRTVEEVVLSLVEHGTLHLLGHHHD